MADLPGEQQRSTHGPRGYPPGPPAGVPGRYGQSRTRRWPWIVVGLTLVFILLFGGCFALVAEFVKKVEERSGREITVTYQVESIGTAVPVVHPGRDPGRARERIVAGAWTKDVGLRGARLLLPCCAGQQSGWNGKHFPTTGGAGAGAAGGSPAAGGGAGSALEIC